MSKTTSVLIIGSIIAIFIGGAVGSILASKHNVRTLALPTETPASASTEPTEKPTVIPGGDAMYGAGFVSPRETNFYLALANGETAASSSWEYTTSLLGTAETGEEYDQGAFCRIFTRPDGTGYDLTYGGSFISYEREYQGVVHRLLTNDLDFEGDPELFSGKNGGDIGIDTDGEYYYLLLGSPKGWTLSKYDVDDYRFVSKVNIDLPEGHANNDQMLRYINGQLVAGGLYDPAYDASNPSAKADLSAPTYTHLWFYTTDLEYVSDVVIDDTKNINGQTLVYYDGTYAIVTADQFQRSTLIAILYDESFNYIETIELQDDAQWSMGSDYRDGLIYIAYHKGPHDFGDAYVDVYTTDWELVESIQVTNIDDKQTAAMHPWVEFDGDRMFVSYAVVQEGATSGVETGKILSCMLSVYDEK